MSIHTLCIGVECHPEVPRRIWPRVPGGADPSGYLRMTVPCCPLSLRGGEATLRIAAKQNGLRPTILPAAVKVEERSQRDNHTISSSGWGLCWIDASIRAGAGSIDAEPGLFHNCVCPA